MSSWFSVTGDTASATLQLRGSWRIASLQAISEELQAVAAPSARSWSIDCAELKHIDTAGAMAALAFVEQQGGSRTNISLLNCSAANQSIFELTGTSLSTPAGLRKKVRQNSLVSLGSDVYELLDSIKSILDFVGRAALAGIRALFQPRRFRYREFAVQLETVGYRAVPIVALVTFLIGIVVAYLTGVQLEQYGANIIIVDGLALGITRELSPILVAIIVAGRSGSAFTAQIGTMKLNEEVDAMTTLGLSPMQVLVLPRTLALMIAMPLLVFIGDITGILGGMMISDFRLNVSTITFIERLRIVLQVDNILVGLVKAPVFAFFIASIGCHLGLNVESNARSVGINTTRTVVRSIVAVILLNAAFAVVFSELGI